MTYDKNHLKTGLLTLVLLLIVLGIGYWYSSVRLSAYSDVANDVLFEQEALLGKRLSELKTNNLPDDVLVSDCGAAARSRFDELLGRLSSLSRTELTELKGLFGGCAYYFSTLESVKAAQISREVAVYKDLLRSLAQLDSKAADKLEAVDVWFAVADQVRTQARLSSELVAVQSGIVDLLLAYTPVNAPAVQDLVVKGQEIRQNIVFGDQQIEQLKTQLYGS